MTTPVEKPALNSYLREHKNNNTTTTTTKCSLHNGTTLMQILPLYYMHLVAASCSYRLVPNTVQLALVVFFLPPTSDTTLAVMVVITGCNLRWWCFSLEHLVHLLMCTQANRHTVQLVLCGGVRIMRGGGDCMLWWSYVVVVMAVHGSNRCGSGVSYFMTV